MSIRRAAIPSIRSSCKLAFVALFLFFIRAVFWSTRNNDFISSNSSSTDHQQPFETTVRCVGSLSNQSCLYRKLYYVNSEFIILTVKGSPLPSYSVRTNALQLWPTVIKTREFESYVALENFVRSVIEPTLFAGVTVYFVQEWHYNIGHALFDGLYPAFVALIRFTPRHLYPFRILTELRDCAGCWSEDIYRRFSGLEMIEESVLRAMSVRRWFVFDELIMGSGAMCQRCTQPNLQLPGGVEMNASRLFRDRMYRQHGLLHPVIRTRTSAERRAFRDVLQAYIIDNKRFADDDKKQIMDAIDEINNDTYSRLNQFVNPSTLRKYPLIHMTYLYYDKVPTRNLTNRTDMRLFVENQFIAQLRLVRRMDIHISAPGTGQMYQTFLSDGSVHINLGGLRSEGTGKAFTSFGEQYMTSGTPYVKGLYYPINERTQGIKKDELVKLVRQAGQLIAGGFVIPVNPYENLATDGRLFVEMCRRDREFCALVTNRSEKTNFACLNFWVEELIHEHRQWKVGGIINNNKNITCSYNQTLLHELRLKYGIQHHDTDG